MLSRKTSQKLNATSKDIEVARILRYTSLVVLALQTTTHVLLLRHVRTRDGPMFTSTTAIVCAELLKVIISLCVILAQEKSFAAWSHHLSENIFRNPLDCLKISVPSMAYALQNNLLYVSLTNLDAATYQVTYQLKILTTALFSVFLLRKPLSLWQWMALVLLFFGVSIVQLQLVQADSSENEKSHSQQLIGVVSLLCACVLSGFAGVYFEKVLKGTPQTLWVRNVQMGTLGAVSALLAVYTKDYETVVHNGFFHGYDGLVWIVIIIQSFGGLVVAVVVKYADNILKGFATSVSIILSCVVSVFIFSFSLSLLFCVGTTLVIAAVFIYSSFPAKAH